MQMPGPKNACFNYIFEINFKNLKTKILRKFFPLISGTVILKPGNLYLFTKQIMRPLNI